MSTQLQTRPPETQPVETPATWHTPAIEEHPTQAPAGGRLRGSARDWITLLVVVLLAAISIVAIVALTSDSTTEGSGYLPAFDSPGGNSLVIPPSAAETYVPAFDSPGGNSLSTVASQDLIAFEGPGGHSLHIP